MKITLSQFVKKAWEYIDQPHKWTKGSRHRWANNGGQQHCAVGALEVASNWAINHGMSSSEAHDLEGLAQRELDRSLRNDTAYPNIGIVTFNDSYATHEALKDVWNKTATRLEKQEGK